jgi:hypothetical protein
MSTSPISLNSSTTSLVASSKGAATNPLNSLPLSGQKGNGAADFTTLFPDRNTFSDNLMGQMMNNQLIATVLSFISQMMDKMFSLLSGKESDLTTQDEPSKAKPKKGTDTKNDFLSGLIDIGMAIVGSLGKNSASKITSIFK